MKRILPLPVFTLPLMLASLSLIMAFGEDFFGGRLRYEREAILAGEVWRLVTGHLVHLGWSHLWLNLAGLALLWILVGEQFTLRGGFVVLLVSALGTSLGLLVLNPELQWYVGLSGVLHGLLAAGAYGRWRQRERDGVLLLMLVALKLGWEQFGGPLPGSEAAAGGPVITDAHLFGAISGLFGLLITSTGVLLASRRSARE